MAEQERFPSTQELANKELLESDEVRARRNLSGEPVEVYAPYATESTETSAYVGVSPEYMTHANETEKPLRADGGVEAQMEEAVFSQVPVVGGGAASATDADTRTAGSGASSDLVSTANSGEGFTAQKAESSEIKVTEEESKPEDTEVKVPVVPSSPSTQEAVVPANRADRPNETPPTPQGEVDGPRAKAKNAGR